MVDRAVAIAATERSTSANVVCQLQTEIRMQRRPRHVVALGQHVPSASAAASSASTSALGSVEVSTGSPAARASATALALLPVSSSTEAGGPTKVMPARAHASASSGFSERKP